MGYAYVAFVKVDDIVAHASVIANLVQIIFPPTHNVGIVQKERPICGMISLETGKIDTCHCKASKKYEYAYVPHCGKLKIFLSFKFCVKSKFENLDVLKQPFLRL